MQINLEKINIHSQVKENSISQLQVVNMNNIMNKIFLNYFNEIFKKSFDEKNDW